MKILNHSICIGSPFVLAIMAMPLQVATGQVAITSSPGFDVSWDGNDGDFFDPTPPPTGALAPDNFALATNGSTAFASSESQFFPTNQIAKLNDGFYGNSNSHINGPGTSPAFHGIALPQPTALTAIAWGRDNGNGAFDDSVSGTDHCGGQCDDRSIGDYTLQFTTAPNPDAATPENEWTSIASLNYTGSTGSDDAPGGLFTEWLRHQYEIGTAGGGPILATGVRILVGSSPNNIAIDEIELYGAVPIPEFQITEFGFDSTTGTATITFSSVPAQFYSLDASDDMTSWVKIDVRFRSQGMETTVRNNTSPRGTSRQFFRVREF